MNNKEKIVKKLLFEIIDKLTKDADVYKHNGSLWLIKTDSRKWVFEFTKSKTLWYNYGFFKSALKFVSLDISEEGNEKYITEWFESRHLNINHVKHTDFPFGLGDENEVEDAIQNGVKETELHKGVRPSAVGDAIQNGVKEVLNFYEPTKYTLEKVVQKGVKETHRKMPLFGWQVEDAIQNGVKVIRHDHKPLQPLVEDAIQNGVKYTTYFIGNLQPSVDDTIQNGVKETKADLGIQSIVLEDTIQNGVKEIKTVDESCFMDYSTEFLYRIILVEDTIQNGVKNTWPDKIPNDYDWSDDFEDEVIDVIQEGVKEIQPLPAQDGNMDWGLYYQRQEDRTKPHIEYVRDVIEEHHHRRREVIVTIKDGVKETHQDCSNNTARVEGIIRVGEKLD